MEVSLDTLLHHMEESLDRLYETLATDPAFCPSDPLDQLITLFALLEALKEQLSVDERER